MKPRFFVLLCLVFFLASCAVRPTTLPELTHPTTGAGGCPTLFPQGDYEFVHLIEFSMPGGQHGTAMGVTVIRGKTISATLMTVEGFVLFSAVFSDTLTVNRAVPPFDKPGFAQGMMADIRAIFLQPQGRKIVGTLAKGAIVCRMETDKETVDVYTTTNRCKQIVVYTPDRNLQTTITGSHCTNELAGMVIPDVLTLQSYGPGGYVLHLRLLRADKIQ